MELETQHLISNVEELNNAKMSIFTSQTNRRLSRIKKSLQISQRSDQKQLHKEGQTI
jgi:hypothetical protein